MNFINLSVHESKAENTVEQEKNNNEYFSKNLIFLNDSKSQIESKFTWNNQLSSSAGSRTIGIKQRDFSSFKLQLKYKELLQSELFSLKINEN